MIFGIIAVLFLLGTPIGRTILIAMLLSGGRGGYHRGGFGGGSVAEGLVAGKVEAAEHQEVFRLF